MQGLNRENGKKISGVYWLEQQINDILTTPKNTRTMRAAYGSNLHDFIDQNVTADFGVEITAEVNSTLSVLSDVFELSSVKIVQDKEKIGIDIVGNFLQTGEEIHLNSVFIN